MTYFEQKSEPGGCDSMLRGQYCRPGTEGRCQDDREQLGEEPQGWLEVLALQVEENRFGRICRLTGFDMMVNSTGDRKLG